MVVWCPDWSVVAALDEAEGSPRSPAAVLSANVVEVCNGPARAEGVRRGQRRRDAQRDLAEQHAGPEHRRQQGAGEGNARHRQPGRRHGGHAPRELGRSDGGEHDRERQGSTDDES